MNYSRRQLEALGEPFGESATRLTPGGGGKRIYGGGGGPTSSTVTQTTIPDYLRPQVEMVLGGGSEKLFNRSDHPDEDGNYTYLGPKSFRAYSDNPADYFAGFSPLQQQVHQNAANLQVPGQFQQGTQFANVAGQGGLDSAQQAQLYGQTAADFGELGLDAELLGQGVTQEALDYAALQADAGLEYAGQMTDPLAVQQYMNPYQSAVTEVQVLAAQRQADIAANARKSQAARAGAYGGSRQAIENAEANRALATQIDTIRAQGQQNAYDKAIQAMQYGSNLNLQGLSGAQSGLNTALQGGQLGLSGIGQAMAGQQAGIAGLGQAGQLYNVANKAADTFGSLGTQQLNAQTGILGLQNQVGGQQQAQEQAITNQAIQTYGSQKENDINKLNQYNALLRGYALPGTTATTYQAAPNVASQVAGLGTAGLAGLGLYNATTSAPR